ncbi:MAG: AraC family transcriptional regulator [Lentisphaeraceae bacterium]|nr:AraC family transcriptional regulator [Lentisphaeraceae bacterium]
MDDSILSNARISEFLEVFNYMPDTFFWVKGTDGKYVTVNDTNLRHYNAHHVSEVRGKSDFDYCARFLAEIYTNDDKLVLAGEEIVNKLEPILQKDWSIRWYMTTKKQLRDENGEVIGTLGFAREVKEGVYSGLYEEEMSQVIEHIQQNYHQKIHIKELAAMVCLSVSAFERKFKKNFNVSPTEFIMNIRVNMVCQKLINSKKGIAEIALDCGFYDHSFMSSMFKRSLNMSPSQFRKAYQ